MFWSRLRPLHYAWFVLLALGSFALAYWAQCPAPPAEPLDRLQAWQESLFIPLAERRLSLRALVAEVPGQLWLQPHLEGPRLVHRGDRDGWSLEAELALSEEQRRSLQRAMPAVPDSAEQPLGERLAEDLAGQGIAQLHLRPEAQGIEEARVAATFGSPRLRLELAEGQAWVYPAQGLTVHLRDEQLVLLHWAPLPAR